MNMNSWLADEILPFTGGTIVDWKNDDSGIVLVIDHAHLRVMSFDSLYEQSCQDKNQPTVLIHHYTSAMLLGLAFIQPKHITVLGLGGGCIVRTLHSLLAEAVVDVVELRQVVVDLAKNHFGLPETPQVKITVSDGKAYLRSQALGSTDIIFADMYHAYGIASFQRAQQFLVLCQQVLSPTGWLVINYHEIPTPTESFYCWLNELFAEVLVCSLPEGNHIIYAGNSKLSRPLSSYIRQTEAFQIQSKASLETLFCLLKPLNQQQ